MNEPYMDINNTADANLNSQFGAINVLTRFIDPRQPILLQNIGYDTMGYVEKVLTANQKHPFS